MISNKLIHGLLVITLFSFDLTSGQKKSIDTADPYHMIAQIAEITFLKIMRSDNDLNYNTQNPSKNSVKLQRNAIIQQILPYIDYQYAAYKVIGVYLNKTTKKQRQNFVEAFRDYLISTYSQAMISYANQKIIANYANKTIIVDKPKKLIDPKNRLISITANIVNKDSLTNKDKTNLALEFKVRKLKNNNWKIYDISAKGVSLLDTKKSELGLLIRTTGIDKVTKLLQQQTQNLLIDKAS